MAMFAADLHLHSQCSDGTWTPTELVEEARAIGLDLIALTDHDTTQGADEAFVAAQRLGMRFLPGVELSTSLDGEWFHVLGLGINPHDEGLHSLCEANRNSNLRSSDIFLESLSPKLGFSLADYEAHVRNPARGGWRSLDFLITRGHCQDVHDYFRRFLKEHGHPAPPVFVHPSEAISAIHAAGGRAILAHPNYEKRALSLSAILSRFHDLGIDGIECFHPRHDDATAVFCKAWAQERGLIVTGGSDCHGSFVGGRALGQPILTEKDLSIDPLL